MLEIFRPLIEAARDLDLTEPATARAELAARLDPEGDAGRALTAALQALLDQGEICDRGEFPMCWSRVSKATPESADHSIDTVHMNGAGPRHRHPRGEVNYCVALDGEPTFDGHPPGWVVLPPDSVHVPTVAGGTMLIVYLLPGGELEFVKD